jgi:predicted metal-dependent phosphoesterase TrpH
LVERAHSHGVELLAITDHDTIAGYLQARHHQPAGLTLIPGVELSCIWQKRLIHVVGLNIDPDNPQLLEGLVQQQKARVERGVLIAQKLEKAGFNGVYERALQLAGDAQLGRPHFARAMVELGCVASEKLAFKRYLGAGKPGDIKLLWPDISQAVEWINTASGVAVLAHPYHYKLTATKLRALIVDFKAAGGQAIEVINGKQPRDRTEHLTRLCEQNDLLASCGSDFHSPQQGWNELGSCGALPKQCKPVWADWSINDL